MNIVMSCVYFTGLTGGELYTYEIGKELVKLGHSVYLVTDYGGEIADRAKEAGLKLFKFEENIRITPDAIYSSDISSTQKMLNKFPTTPVIMTCLTEFYYGKPIVHPNIKKYAYVRENVLANLLNNGVLPEKTVLIENCFDFERFNTKDTSLPDKKVVFFAGTFDRRRWATINNIIERSQKEDFEFWLMGKNFGMNLTELEKKARIIDCSWNTENYVKQCTETAGILMGRTTIEGWLCGKPGWIYDIKENGEIKSYNYYLPPPNLEKYNIKYVGAKVEKELLNLVSTNKKNQGKIISVPKNNQEDSWRLEKIPKIAHTYWGGTKLTFLRYMTLYSFTKLNPDWKLRLYTPVQLSKNITWSTGESRDKNSNIKDYWSEVEKLPVELIKVDMKDFNKSNNLPEVHKSNVVQEYYLSTCGGVWLDSDILFFRKMNSLYFNTEVNQGLECAVCVHKKKYSPAFEFASENNLFHKSLYTKIEKMDESEKYQGFAALLREGEFNTIEDIVTVFPHMQSFNINLDVVFSYSGLIKDYLDTAMWIKDGNFIITPDTIGIHWYGGNSISYMWENKLNRDNFEEYTNPICLLIKTILNLK